MTRTYWVYILASRPRGALYIGMTNNPARRVDLHRTGLVVVAMEVVHPGLGSKAVVAKPTVCSWSPG